MSHFYDITLWQYVVVFFLFFFKIHYLLLKLSVLIYLQAKSVSVHFEFLCWYLTFWPVIYYCLMLLWLQTIPRNKKNVVPKKLFGCSSAAGCHSSVVVVWSGGEAARRRREIPSTMKIIHRNHNFSSIRDHFSDFLLYQKGLSFLFKWSPEPSSSTLSFNYGWLCKFIHWSLMQQERRNEGRKRLSGGVQSPHHSSGIASGFFRARSLWECTVKWDSPEPYGWVMSSSMAAAPAFQAHFYTVHISCKWAFTELVINLQ